jgi:carbamoylphosphate synthase large subunit
MHKQPTKLEDIFDINYVVQRIPNWKEPKYKEMKRMLTLGMASAVYGERMLS